ncbi:MerR family transcriptional regulator [Brachybacterium sp. NPDC056505]|uniref:MerR family transcriptional regulator n=1 Tax=Brachybacterium sp. NPDC056505 TaxID=3345843 RepID=UPI00366AB847
MLSSELADLAGVTVRTLRHYHQIGLLPEPPRTPGDYRQYDVGHLVRVLRITQLTELGVPLSSLSEVLDDPTTAETLLDQLDGHAAAEIERLTARRASISVLRSTGAPPDLPPELSAWHTGPRSAIPADMVRFETEQLILIARLLGSEGATSLANLLQVPDGSRSTMDVLAERFYALDSDTPDRVVDQLVDDWAGQIEPLVATTEGIGHLDPRAADLLDQLSARDLQPIQHRTVRALQRRLARKCHRSQSS